MSLSGVPSLYRAPQNCNTSLRRVLILSALLGACGGQSKAGFDFNSTTSQQQSMADSRPSSTSVPAAATQPTLLATSPKIDPETVYDAEEEVNPCPPEMVNIADKYCIDRHEITLFDIEKGRELSPYYPAERKIARMSYFNWKNSFWRKGTGFSKRTRPPKLPEWQIDANYTYKARSVADVIPHGYLSGLASGKACTNAGKRLCQVEEWRKACKSENETRHPYGDTFVYGKCNYGRFPHPARLLHGDELAKNLWDPRINVISARGEQYLHKTGFKSECASTWNGDAAYDMIGNLDEWALDGEKPVMLGGGYVRGWTKLGCNAKLAGHAPAYFDYSIGTRCCSDVQK